MAGDPFLSPSSSLAPTKNLLLFKPSKIENQRLVKVQVSNMPALKCGGILGISASGTAPSKLAAIRWSYGSRPAWCSRGSQTPGTRQPAGLQAARPFCSRSDLEERGACGPPRPDPQTRPSSNFRPWPAQTPDPDPNRIPDSDPGLDPGPRPQTLAPPTLV